MIQTELEQHEPSPNGADGHNADGTFAKGNRGGPGNPYARKVARLRNLLLEAVSEEDLRQIVRALVEQAKAGDLTAVREVLNRLLGKSPEPCHPDRLEADEIRVEADRLQAERSRRMAKPGLLDELAL